MHLIVDIDGTLSDHSHRWHLIDKPDAQQSDWDAFLEPELVAKDPPFPLAQKAMERLIKYAASIRFLTGRQEQLRDVTVAWLYKHFGIAPGLNELLMRPTGEQSTATEHKGGILRNRTSQEVIRTWPLILVDDDPYILHLYAEFGLAIKAPECWELLVHDQPLTKEPLFNK